LKAWRNRFNIAGEEHEAMKDMQDLKKIVWMYDRINSDSHNLDFFMFMFLIQESRTGGRSLLESGNSKRMLTKQLTKDIGID
jgi:hypothetical protein